MLLEVPSETRTLEFKRLGEVKIEKILRSITAMANTDGGLFVLGIDDPEKTQKKGLARIMGKNLASIEHPKVHQK
jgi:predicted HTH transcriptional regulator